MKKLSLGYMINNIRTTMGVTLEELAEGLCTPSTMFRYETGERIPDPKSWDGKNSILCGDEINLFLIYLKYQLQMGRMGAEEADKICGNLRHYVETRVDDVFEKARIYPRVICF